MISSLPNHVFRISARLLAAQRDRMWGISCRVANIYADRWSDAENNKFRSAFRIKIPDVAVTYPGHRWPSGVLFPASHSNSPLPRCLQRRWGRRKCGVRSLQVPVWITDNPYRACEASFRLKRMGPLKGDSLPWPRTSAKSPIIPEATLGSSSTFCVLWAEFRQGGGVLFSEHHLHYHFPYTHCLTELLYF